MNKGPLGYLSVTVNADPADARTDQIPGDVTLGGRIAPGWGLHLADMNLAMGNLLALIEAQTPKGRSVPPAQKALGSSRRGQRGLPRRIRCR
ncbi:MAG: hypothetical protein M3Q08_11960 [Pseudomonadota bacterium]|nr:hypothetical protein [Pseudomonadota bacterium]